MNTVTAASRTRLPRTSSTVTYTCNVRFLTPYRTADARTMGGGVIVTGTVAVSGPVGVATVATTCPPPTRPDAVKVVVGPAVGDRVPGVPGASVHAAESDGIGFPNASMPTALNDVVVPSGRLAAAGSIRIETASAPEIVNACVPVTAPGALALSAGAPAVVSS